MDNDIPEIKEHPASGCLAFSLAQGITCFVQLFFHIVDKGVYLAVAVSVRNNEIICQDRDACDIDDFDAFYTSSLFSL